jgi:hypothetical protein
LRYKMSPFGGIDTYYEWTIIYFDK